MKIIGIVFFITTINALLSYLNSRSREKLNNHGNEKVLKHPAIYMPIGIAMIVLISLISIGGFRDAKTQTDIVGWAFFWGVFVLIIISMIFAEKNSKVIFNEEEIKSQNFLGFRKRMFWKDICKIRYSFATLTLKDKGGRTISVYLHYVGFHSFLDTIERKIPLTVYARALENVKRFQKKTSK
jgi:amino acid transporter